MRAAAGRPGFPPETIRGALGAGAVTPPAHGPPEVLHSGERVIAAAGRLLVDTRFSVQRLPLAARVTAPERDGGKKGFVSRQMVTSMCFAVEFVDVHRTKAKLGQVM